MMERALDTICNLLVATFGVLMIIPLWLFAKDGR